MAYSDFSLGFGSEDSWYLDMDCLTPQQKEKLLNVIDHLLSYVRENNDDDDNDNNEAENIDKNTCYGSSSEKNNNDDNDDANEDANENNDDVW